MKKPLILAVLILLSITGCREKEASNPIEGAWNLIYVRNVVNDSVVSEFPLTYLGADMKFWTGEHWCFVGTYSFDTMTVDNYGGGTYTLDGNIYLERIKYHANKEYLGRELRMLMTVKNDTLIQIWPVDEKGQVNKSNCTVERYTRLK